MICLGHAQITCNKKNWSVQTVVVAPASVAVAMVAGTAGTARTAAGGARDAADATCLNSQAPAFSSSFL